MDSIWTAGARKAAAEPDAPTITSVSFIHPTPLICSYTVPESHTPSWALVRGWLWLRHFSSMPCCQPWVCWT